MRREERMEDQRRVGESDEETRGERRERERREGERSEDM